MVETSVTLPRAGFSGLLRSRSAHFTGPLDCRRTAWMHEHQMLLGSSLRADGERSWSTVLGPDKLDEDQSCKTNLFDRIST